jgi:lysophosphatidylcholine acyltransferase/lyso-PAF acetyltransferase
VSRIENSRIPFIGLILRAIQPIYVSREDSENRILVVKEIKKRALLNSDWPQLLIFPEGTTTNRSCLITFKPGAFIPGLPVQPIAIKYKNKLDTITWTWEGLKAFKVILYTLCQFSNYMEVTFLPVYVPNDQEKMDAKVFANNVRSKMAE